MTRLFINWYEENDKERREELTYALRKNVYLELIDNIVNISNVNLPAWAGAKIQNISHPARPAFRDFFQVINRFAQANDVSIISNLDIYFDDSLRLLDRIETNECYALTRYNMINDVPVFFNRADSQDVWIFKGPVREIKEADFTLGFIACDNRLAFLLSQYGYRVTNPSLSILSYHVHKSEKRSYINHKGEWVGPRIPGPYGYVNPVTI